MNFGMFQLICPSAGNTQYIQNTWEDKEQHKDPQKQTNTCYINDNGHYGTETNFEVVRGLSGKYPAISNILRTSSVALM
jgi:hypothetical protein